MGESGSKLFEMMSDLSKHPEKLGQFKSDPDRAMSGYGLSAAQKTLVKSAIEDDKHHDLLKALGDEVHTHFHASQNLFC